MQSLWRLVVTVLCLCGVTWAASTSTHKTTARSSSAHTSSTHSSSSLHSTSKASSFHSSSSVHSTSSISSHASTLPSVFEKGPVLIPGFPDPSLIQINEIWYAFATRQTNSAGKLVNVQVASSSDFITWEIIGGNGKSQFDAFPKQPAWVDQSAANIWAPDVNQLDDGTFVMYFSGSTAVNSARHCVGAATARNVTGPYTGLSEPLFCPLAQGGAEDASGFKDWHIPALTNNGTDAAASSGGYGGQRYIIYKVDGNSLGSGLYPTPIMMHAVASDGVTLQGLNYTLLDNDGASDQGLIEAPSLVKTGPGAYMLFFSSGLDSGSEYTVSYATSDSVNSAYVRHPPLLKTGDYGLYSPGGADVSFDLRHIVFHADATNCQCYRQMYVGEIQINGTVVSI